VGDQNKHTALEGRVEELAAMDEKVIGSGAGIKDKLNKLNPPKNMK